MTNHLQKKRAKSLIFWLEGRVRFDADQESSLKIANVVDIHEELVRLVFRDDAARLDDALIILEHF